MTTSAPQPSKDERAKRLADRLMQRTGDGIEILTSGDESQPEPPSAAESS